MSNHSPNKPSTQSVRAGRDAIQVGGNFTRTQTTNFNFVFFLVGILALGGLSWGIYMAGVMPGAPGGPSQTQNR